MAKPLDWLLQDPKGQPIEVVRDIRDEIRQRVVDLAKDRTLVQKRLSLPKQQGYLRN
jgi:hypothetical protein